MSIPARAMTKQEAFDEIVQLADPSVGWIKLEGTATPQRVSLDGWDPFNATSQAGNVGGIIIRHWPSGTRALDNREPHGTAPDLLDPRHALALFRLCRWLSENWSGLTELYHVGISGDGTGQRIDCHGQGRAADFIGVGGTNDDGDRWNRTVNDDWGTVSTALTPGGNWPAGTGSNVSYRLAAPEAAAADEWSAGFFRELYAFIASEWQDRSDDPDGPAEPTTIGERSFIMHPDHPATAPGTPHGREAHKTHIHMQIGATGTE
ncbi:hypothetical protein MOQ72_43260 [Saccharopolyspora sp. K220]|uniref:hypothetical protein n=1 Tax=Saccharopolyspora soli TaxID=2926618 RepID=UPI001F565575|nr:hypothetical protein [Saccharopolyspora soli]MCI2424233.1 hypothetical protein [Saccharopolyspora soli]